MIWQYSYINRLLDLNYNCLSDALNDNGLIDSKLKFIPDILFKFYSPTDQNLLDIREKRIWLPSPTVFNDPFECSIGFNMDEYIKSIIIKFALREQKKKCPVATLTFTREDLYQIYNSYTKEPAKAISQKKVSVYVLCKFYSKKMSLFKIV